MKDPRTAFSRLGLLQYIAHLNNVEEALFFITEHEGDLELDDADLDLIYKAQDLFRDTKWLDRVLD